MLLIAALTALALYFSRRPRPLQVVSVTPASALDDVYRPVEEVESFGPDDTFFLSVEVRGYRPSEPLIARWYYAGDVITESTFEATLASGSYDGYVGFVLRNENPPWPTGRYSAEIVFQDQVLGSVDFAVEDEP